MLTEVWSCLLHFQGNLGRNFGHLEEEEVSFLQSMVAPHRYNIPKKLSAGCLWSLEKKREKRLDLGSYIFSLERSHLQGLSRKIKSKFSGSLSHASFERLLFLCSCCGGLITELSQTSRTASSSWAPSLSAPFPGLPCSTQPSVTRQILWQAACKEEFVERKAVTQSEFPPTHAVTASSLYDRCALGRAQRSLVHPQLMQSYTLPSHTPWLEVPLFQRTAYTYPKISSGDHINFSMTKRGCCSCSTSPCVLPCPQHSSSPLPSSAPPLSVCPINLLYFPPTQICTLLSIQSLLFRVLKQKRSYSVSWQEVPSIQQSLRAALIDSFLPNTKNGACEIGEFKDVSFPEFHRTR